MVLTDRKRFVPLFPSLTATVISWICFSLGQLRRQSLFFLHQFFSLLLLCICVCVCCVCVVCMCVCAGPTFRLMACGTFSFTIDQNSTISNITTNWPTCFSWVIDTCCTGMAQCPPGKMLLGFTVKKHRGLVTILPLLGKPRVPPSPQLPYVHSLGRSNWVDILTFKT